MSSPTEAATLPASAFVSSGQRGFGFLSLISGSRRRSRGRIRRKPPTRPNYDRSGRLISLAGYRAARRTRTSEAQILTPLLFPHQSVLVDPGALLLEISKITSPSRSRTTADVGAGQVSASSLRCSKRSSTAVECSKATPPLAPAPKAIAGDLDGYRHVAEYVAASGACQVAQVAVVWTRRTGGIRAARDPLDWRRELVQLEVVAEHLANDARLRPILFEGGPPECLRFVVVEPEGFSDLATLSSRGATSRTWILAPLCHGA